MKGKLKKQLSILLTVLLLFLYVIYPPLSFAQEVTPTDTPTPTPTVDISNNATVSSNLQSDANTGDNTITATDSAQTENATSSGSDNSLTNSTGDSSGSDSDNTSPSSPSSTIDTGDATSSIAIINDVNTNSVNSAVVNQTINIFVSQDGSIDLSDPFTIAANAISTHPEDSVINVSVTNVNNYAYITNDVASAALTGDNLIDSSGQSATITTGNAYSAVSLLNQVNFTVVNSQIHLVTINIFGNLNGNIILPDLNASTNCAGCGVDVNASNTAAVTNNLSSTADTGNNSIVATGSTAISTGDAQSAVNSLNVVNTNVLGTNAEVLYINDLGTWNGNFIGWGNFDPTEGGASLALYDFSPNGSTASDSSQTTINNTVVVDNNVSSLASSGGNSISGGDSSISTGNSFSVISLMNFINTNFIDSFGFFGFINIFGNWTGDIGGQSEFAALSIQNTDVSPTISSDNTGSSDSNTPQEQGGQLSVENTNNVGAFVYPGDTVTFFLKVKNTGTGTVYGANLALELISNGQTIGTANFNLGDIQPQKGVKVTTGIVLPKNVAGGLYIARAIASGNVGPDNSGVSATADSNFNVLSSNATFAYSSFQPPHVTVLGAHNKAGTNLVTAKNAQETPYLFSLLMILLAYVFVRGIKKRKYLQELLSSTDLKDKLSSLRMFLF
jgi:hypothetical protein